LRIGYSNGVVFTNVCKTLLIMKLTGKCFEDFLSFFNSKRRGTEVSLYQLPELFQNALIIEFFDSVGIYILIDMNGGYFHFIIKETNKNSFGGLKKHWQDGESKTRVKSTNSAIEKANEIYNQNK